VVAFRPEEDPQTVGGRVLGIRGMESCEIPHIPLDPAAFEPHTARAQASHLAHFWKQCLTRD
jgi:hypothetical protein